MIAVRDYWNEHVHDLDIATQPVGTPTFFQELEAYRFAKLRYLAAVVDSPAHAGKRLLEIGCGAGIDLCRLARAGAVVTGIDLAPRAVDLARQNLEQQGLAGALGIMDGEELAFEDGQFDLVYAHGVLQYTAYPTQMIAEIHRVLRPNGQAIVMAYNRYSWLVLLSGLTRVEMEHVDAPFLRLYSADEFRRLLAPFAQVRIVAERFPVPTELHGGWKAWLYNNLFVPAFGALPERLARPLGWHLLAFASKV